MKLNGKFITASTGLNIRFTRSCVSTFDEIEDFDVIVALRQKNGVGRGEHTFASPPGGLYIVLRLIGRYDAHTLTPSVGIAVHDTVAEILGLDTELKWVNDVFYKGKKAVGILCKCPRKDEYLVGIGINYATKQSALDNAGLNGIATTLGAPEEKASEFVAALLNRIYDPALCAFDSEKYSSLCMNIGKTVEFTHNGAKLTGLAERVNEKGSLVVCVGEETVAVDAGEVVILKTEA